MSTGTIIHVQMREPIAEDNTVYKREYIYRVPVEQGRRWIRNGWAEETKALPLHEQQILSRLTRYKYALFLPFTGEFGHKIMTHIRLVHFNESKHKVVCCSRGEEVLYPSANAFYYDWSDPLEDKFKCSSDSSELYDWSHIVKRYPKHRTICAGGLTPEAEIFPLYPEKSIPFKPKARALKVDVCIGVRWRDFCSERNFQHYQFIADKITELGFSFATIGQKPTSLDLKGQLFHTSDYGDTDASIEAMQACKLYIGTDTGISHLASTVGCNMLLWREIKGKSRDLTDRMRIVNRNKCLDVVSDGWDNPQLIVDKIRNILKA